MPAVTPSVSLMGYLLRLGRDERERLAAAWGLAVSEATPASLYDELTGAWCLATALERLPQRSRQVFASLVDLGRGATLRTLSVQLLWSEEEVTGAVATLSDWGLGVRVGEGSFAEVVVANEVLQAARRLKSLQNQPAPVPPTLHRALECLDPDALERLARRWGLDAAGPWLRSETLDQLQRRMATRAETRRVAEMVSPATRRLLLALHRSGGHGEAAALSAATGLDHRGLLAAAREARGFFPLAESYAGGTRGLVLPVGLGELTDDTRPTPPSSMPRAVPGPSLSEPQFLLARDLLYLLAYLRSAEPPVARLPLAGSHARLVSAGVSPADAILQDEYLAFVVGVAQGLGLIAKTEGGVRPTARAVSWERLDCAAQTLAAFRWWLETDRWREGLRQSDRDLGGPVAFALGRERLVQAIAECEPGCWYMESEFLAWLREREPLLFRDRRALARAVNQKGIELAARHWDSWDGRLAQKALHLSLRWLGALATLDLPTGSAIALTSLGAWLCGRLGARQAEWPTQPPLRFAESGQVDLEWPSGPAVAALLAYARPETQGRYLINAPSVAWAIRSGVDAERILTDLGHYGEVPAPLTTAVRQWAGKVRLLRLGRPLLLEAATQADLDVLFASPRYRALALQRLSPTAALVGDEGALARMAGRLRRDGYVLEHGWGAANRHGI